MQSKHYKLTEFFLIFFIAPISFVLNFSIWLKLSIGLIGFVYIIFVLLKVEKNKFKIAKNLDWTDFWKRTTLLLVGIALITSAFVWLTDRPQLFSVMLNNMLFWLFILLFYSLFSVYPQELIYRTFYFQRYEELFRNKNLLLFVNAIVFSLGHIFFRNALVMIITFLGGLLFALTYYRTKSTLLVSIEHAIYGCWLFTVGMGGMLGFPTGEN